MPAYSTSTDEIEADIRSLPVTFDPLPGIEGEGLSWSDRRLMEESFDEAQKGTTRSIRTFKHLSRKYPKVVSLKNHLCVAYSAAGKGSLAKKLIEEIFESHPDYLFGRVNFAALFLNEGAELHRIPELLGESLRLGDMKPDIDLFHISQIRAFYDIVALFHLKSDRPDLAKAIHRVLEDIIGDYDDPALGRLQLEIASYNIDSMKRRMKQDEARAIRVSVDPRRPPDESVDLFPPGFHHPEIEEFYRFDFELSDSRIETILALPRKTLIRDLEAVLEDTLARGGLYRKYRIDFEEEETFFPLHAMFFLGDLKAVDSLPVVLEFLTQSEEAIGFWIGDYLVNDFWQPLSQIAGDRLDQTTGWMLSPGIPSRSREAMGIAAAQIALHQPERRAEILDWFQGILEFLLDSPPEDNILDTDLVTGLVWQLLNLRAVELQPLITAHFEKGYIALTQVGDLDEIVESLAEPPVEEHRKPILSLQILYDRLRNPVFESPFPPLDDYWDDGWGKPERPGPISGFPEPPFSAANPLERDTQGMAVASDEPRIKVGRNEPCPCGSGKKYKKCCG